MPIQQLMRVPPEHRDLDWLKHSLQAAIRLEHATIPPYLCAYWSVRADAKTKTTQTIRGWIRGIVLQEMLHMGLACNLLTAIGGTPNIYCAGFVPKYPGPLPGGVHPGLTVSLAGLAKDDPSDPVKKKEVVQTFMQIELPEKPLALRSAQLPTYRTIGEFYDAINQAFNDLQPSISLKRQLLQDDVGLTVIAVLQDAQDAITLIKTQGEGTAQSPVTNGGGGGVLDPDKLAHYYKFASIYHERTLKYDPSAPNHYSFTGDKLPFPPAAELYLMAEVPPGGYPGVQECQDFDAQYTSILKALHGAWETGDAKLLSAAIFGKAGMDNLTSKALALLKLGKPAGSGSGIVGPTFLFRP
jgi:hypothetical protein